MLSARVQRIGVSPTMKIAARAIEMKKSGMDIVDFSVGEPDFPTPEFIKEAARAAIAANKTKYTENVGLLELRQAVARKLRAENGLAYEPSQIIISSGAKQSIFNVVMSLIGKDDEVIIPAPYYVSYPEMVRLAQGRPVIVPTSEDKGFKLSGDQLARAISAKTRALIICNPSNPTGTVYSASELAALAAVVEQKDIFVISDEIYEKLIFDRFPFTSFAGLSPAMMEKTIVINGVSKAFAMTGWRLGYAAGPPEIIKAAAKIQSHSTSNASTIAQYAALAALGGPHEAITPMVNEFERRRDYLNGRLNAIPGVSCTRPAGAFYAFPNISNFLGKSFNGKTIHNSSDLAEYLLTEAKVVVVPGAAFGAEGYIRISYSTAIETIARGVQRIADALSQLT